VAPDLEILVLGSEDRLRLFSDVLAEIRFADGTRWSRQDIISLIGVNGDYTAVIDYANLPRDDLLEGTAADDTIYGGDGNDTLIGGAGNDYLDGSYGDDVLEGGTGNDTLYGGFGNNTYRFSAGFGHDSVSVRDNGLYQDGETGYGQYDADWIEFDATLTPDDILVERGIGQRPGGFGWYDSDDLILRVDGAEDVIRVGYGLRIGSTFAGVRFADGTVWTRDYLATIVQPTPGIDAQSGYGSGTLIGTDGVDDLEGSSGDDILIGGGSSDYLYGDSGDDILDGGKGGDYLEGGSGRDTYRFSAGFGTDYIWNEREPNGADAIEFDTTIGTSDIIVEYIDGRSDLILRVAGTNDSITIGDAYGDEAYGVDEVRFADGTVWTRDQLVALAIPAREGVSLVGDSTDAVLLGSDFNDFIDGGDGNEELIGGDGNDELYGNAGADILDGGAGDDYLEGGAGDDIFRFSAGMGSDYLALSDYSDTPDSDTILFDATIDPDSVIISRYSNDWDGEWLINFIGSDDQIDFWELDENDRIVFADGTIWDYAEIIARVQPALGTYQSVESSPDIVGTDGWDRLWSNASGPATLTGLGGDDDLQGTDFADTLDGGTGDDYLSGGGGEDTYLFSAGFGQDTIYDYGYSGEIDHIVFDASIDVSAIIVEFEGFQGGEFGSFIESVSLRVRGTEDRIYIGNSYGAYGINFDVRFADGTVWSPDDVLGAGEFRSYSYIEGDQGGAPLIGSEVDDTIYGGPAGELLDGGAGQDRIYGGDGDDIIIGGTGNDLLDGGTGSDTYRFSAGFGEDRIEDYTDYGDHNIIEFDASITAANIVVHASDSDRVGDYFLTFTGSEDRLWISRYGSEYPPIAELRFADGTVWTWADLQERLTYTPIATLTTIASGGTLTGTAGNDRLTGSAGADIITGDSSQIYLTTGANLIVNGGFEQLGGTVVSTSFGMTGTLLPGWTRINTTQSSSAPAFEQVFNGYSGVAATEGAYWLDLDGVTGSGWGSDSNLTIVQDIAGLTAGQTMLIGFDHANRTSATSGSFDVLWNGVVIASITDTGTTMRRDQLIVTAIAGTNSLGFRSTGSADGAGASLDNVAVTTVQQATSARAGDDLLSGLGGNDVIYGGGGDDTISGGADDDTLFGGAGNDTINGDAGNDIITGGTGNDALLGGLGNDSYRFARGDGQDVITDNGGADRIEFAAGIGLADLRVLQSGTANLVLTIAGTEDRITLVNAQNNVSYQIETIAFADGTTLTAAQLIALSLTGDALANVRYGTAAAETIDGQAGDDTLYGQDGDDRLIGGTGNDVLYGGNGNDILAGGTGLDALDGGTGNDTYRFNAGDGQDTITDASGTDRIEFGAGISAAATHVVKSGANNFVLTFDGNEDRLTIVNAQSNSAYQIESIAFVDGTIWTAAELLHQSMLGTPNADVYTGTAGADDIAGQGGDDNLTGLDGDDRLSGGIGNDLLNGGGGADRLEGGAGNDQLVGGQGGDTYVYSAGDGSDVIDDRGDDAPDQLRIQGYTLDQLRFSRQGNDLVVRFAGNGDRIIVLNGLAPIAATRIENIVVVDDALALSMADVVARLVPDVPTTGQWLVGTDGDDILAGGQGDDYLDGGQGADTLSGGGGNDQFAGLSADDAVDVLTGGAGRDVYHYLPVSGDDPVVADIITDFTPGAGGDIIRLATSNPNPFEGGNLYLSQDGADALLIRRGLNGPDQVLIRLAGVSASALTSANFDGVPIAVDNSISINDSDDAHVLSGAELDDRIFGNGGADTIYGYAGNDRLAGGADGDTIDGGFGNDLISGQEGADILIGGQGSDILSGGTGDDRLIGYDDGSTAADRDVFEGGEGDDALFGGLGDDTYYFARGDGRDTIDDLGGVDRIVLAAGIVPADVAVVQVGNDIELRIAGQGGRIRLIGAAADGTTSIEALSFADGTTWDWSAILTRSLTASAGDDVLRLVGAANTLAGGAGNDTLTGGAGDDVLTGGTGSDLLQGGAGNDSYVFARGDGQDRIVDTVGINTLAFAAGIAPSEVRVVRGTTNLVLEIVGTGDRVDLGTPAQPGMGVARATFADGTEWTEATLIALARAGSDGADVIRGDAGDNVLAGGAGDDLIFGDAGSDTLDGGTGSDRLEGGAGDDRYRFAANGGHDRIFDSAGNDVLELAADILVGDIEVQQSRDGANFTLIVRSTGARITIENALGTGIIETIRFADGTAWTIDDLIGRAPSIGDDVLTGDARANLLIGGFGNDVLSGLGGNDTYRFARGDGSDVIRDGASSNADRLEISGYGVDDISFHRVAEDSNDVVIRFADSDDQIVIVDALAGNFAGIEAVALDGGTSFDVAAIRAAVLANVGTDGNDTVIGTGGDDDLRAGRGNDLVVGGAGADIYRYARGDGDDRIDAFGSGADQLVLDDYALADVVSAVRGGPDSNDLVISFVGVGDRLVLLDALADGNGSSGNSLIVRFADGTVWNRDAMRARALADIDGAGNDNVYGFGGADNFAARAGNDLLAGAGGGDSYAFGRGAGNDTIADNGTNGTDSVQIRDFASSEVEIERLYRGSDSIVLRFAGNNADSLTIIDALATDAKGIESYTFADGVVWTKDIIRQLLDNRAPSAADDGYFSATTGIELVISAADILRNDFDADGDALRIVAVDGGEHGVATLDAQGNVHYTAIGGYYGPASISYIVADGRNGFDTATIDLRVRPVATALPDTGFVVAEDGSIVIRTERLLSNDLDGDRMVVGQVFGAKNGSVALSSDGNISFTPTADFNGIAEFTYVANTPEGGRAEAKVTIEVTAVNDAPVARNDSAPAVAEGTRFTIDPRTLTANDIDIDGDALTVVSVIGNGNVAVTLNSDGMIDVAPRDYYWGAAYLDYVVRDPSGATSTGRVSFTVTPVNDVPEPLNDRFTLTEAGDPILEDNPIVIGADRLIANDIEHDGDPLTVIAVGNSHGGRATLLANATVLFTPNANFNGEAWFDYQVDDGQGGTAWARATIVYQPVNDRPNAANDSYDSPGLGYLRGPEDIAIEIPILDLLKNDSDVEGFAVKFESAGNAVHGDITLTDRGTIIFTPDQDYWGDASFSYLISDNEGEVDAGIVTLHFDNVGDAPPEARRDTIYVNEDIPTVIPIAALLANDSDVDRDPLRFVGWRLATSLDGLKFGADAGIGLRGTLEFDADGNLVYTPNRDASSAGGFVYGVTDDAQGVSEGYVDIVIIPSNDDPTVNDDEGFVTPLDAPLVLRVSSLLANDFDIEQADHDGDGQIDDILDNPNRARPTFVGIEGVYDASALALGQRISVGSAQVVSWASEQFVVVTFPAGFTGQVAVEYRIADADGATDTGFATATVADFYAGLLRGTAKADYLAGTPLADLIEGFAGPDYILGGAGDDVIYAGDGADRIDGGSGDDWIDAGDGADTIIGGTGFDTVSFAASDVGLRADLESRIGQGGFAQGDTFQGIEALIGSEFADQLGGDGANNRLEGLGGDDLIEGRGGNDVLLGGDGDDVLSGGAGADVIDGGAGNDTADYSFGATGVVISLANGTAQGGDAEGDVLTGIENLIGTDAADVLEGDDDANRLFGGRGDDVLRGGAGDDILSGGRGADQLIGGDGFDIADYTLSAEAVTIDLADAQAGGGDAAGDTFSGIEVVQGSYHDDIIRGDAQDNRIRGGRGADLIDGRDGFDTADYSASDDAVTVDLGSGLGSAGEAAGDRLISIEKLIGSLWNDTLSGGAADDTFQGLRGNDRIAGGAGSDTYLFSFDDGQDLIVEQGAASDIDRLVLGSAVAPKDLSVLREGNDLLLEFERQDGFLVDTVRVKDHFLGAETGIELVVFANGTSWDRAKLEELQRLGRFNAADDIVRFAQEDVPVLIDPAVLIVNDAELDTLNLTLVGVDRPTHGTVRLADDGKIEFIGAPNFNGDAFFYYTVRDDYGRESSARVEVNLSAVNDAPTAVDDPLVYGVEDTTLRIRIENLLANDFDVDGDAAAEGLHIVAISPLVNDAGTSIDAYKDSDHAFKGTNVTANISGDYIELAIRPDYFGPAGFIYTLADADGATSTAKVEIYITPVNDAPRASTTVHSIRLETTVALTVADLLANTYDIEGDAVTFVGLHPGADNNPANNGEVSFDTASGVLQFTPWSLGAASIEYDVIDARGAAATLTYRFNVRPLNDPPKANNDYGLRTLQNEVLIIDPFRLLANDSDENGDTLIIESVSRFADGGKILLRDDGKIEFRPRLDYNGSAGFDYTITDGRGGHSTAHVSITILPHNEGPVLRNDLVSGIEDTRLYVIPAEAFGNDLDPEGDVLFFKRSAVLGVIDHRFLSAGFTVDARATDGSSLPAWLAFDAATMRFTGTPPAEAGAKVTVDVWVTDPANGRIFNRRLNLDTNQLGGGIVVRDTVLEGFAIRTGFAVDFEFGADDLDAETSVAATLADGSPLPNWLAFDASQLRFSGTAPDGGGPLAVTLRFTRPAVGGGAPLSWEDSVTIDPAQLAEGFGYDSNLALFDLKSGTVSASLIGSRPLPEYLSFDAATRTVSLSGFAPEPDDQLARLQVVFTPATRLLPNGVYASSDRGFTLEFLVDPQADLATQVEAINRALAGNAFFAAQGLFALDLDGAGAISAARESGAPLPDWLHFDAGSLSFTGTPPPAWIGAVPVRMNVGAGNGLPALSIITEAVVDDTFRLNGLAAGTSTAAEEIGVSAPKDFDGTIVLSYDATDEKGGVSTKPALIFYDVKPARERPDANPDDIAVREGESVRFAIADLAKNDFDRDGDPLHIAGLGTPAHGTLTIELAHVAIDPPAVLAQASGAIWSATLADGSALPGWLTIDTATGVLSGDVPLAFVASLDIRFSRTLNGDSVSALQAYALNGNIGAYATYTPDEAYSGDDQLSYSVTDGREGASTGQANIHVAPLNDPPVAVADRLSGIEDTPLLIDPAALLANDYDVDGNPIRFLGVTNAVHGSVTFDGINILFTPDANFSGEARFEYLVTDDTHGTSTGRVIVDVVSTNRAPIAAADVFATVEDTPFEFTTAQLLANDSDPDGDTISFQSISRSSAKGKIYELPGGRWQFVPDENVNGPVTFSYTIGDGRRSQTGTITFNIAAVNDAPIANADGPGTGNNPEGVFRTTIDQALTIDFAALIANDRDVEGDSFSIVEVFDGDQGSVTRVGDTAVFTPDAGYVGDAGFHYRVTDSHGASSVGYVTLLVYPDVPLPIPVSDRGFEVLEDSYLDIDPAELLANDFAPEGSTLSFVRLDGATLLENGKYRFTPEPNFNGEVELRYWVENEQGFPVSSTVTINVLPVADAPVAGDDSLIMREDTPLTIFASQLLANDYDVDFNGIAIDRIIATSGVTVTDIGFGQFQITPDQDRNGDAWFDYELVDSTGLSTTARVNITIEAVNDAPVIAAIPVLKGIEDQPFSAQLPDGFASDVDGDALLVEIRGKDGAAMPAWLAYDRDTRTLSGQPPADFNGVVALEISASDGNATTVRELIVSIAPVNDAPVLSAALADLTSDEDTPFAFALQTDRFADVDGDTLSYTVTLDDGSPLPAWLGFDGAVLSGTPPQDFNGTLTLAITASDGNASVSDIFTLTIAPVNDAPVLAVALDDRVFAEDGLIDFVLPANAFTDVDGDALTVAAGLANGDPLPDWLSFVGGRFTGQPPQDFNGALSIVVTASDGVLAASGSFTLTIAAVNDAPEPGIALSDRTFAEDSPVSVTIPAGAFTDRDGDTLVLNARLANGDPLPAWLSFDGSVLSGQPPRDFNGALAIEIVASDGALTARQTFALTIAPVNDAPITAVALGDATVAEDTPFTIEIPAGTFTDVDGDALNLSATLANGDPLPDWIAFDGSRFTGTPPANFNGSIALRVVASDGMLNAQSNFTLTVTPVNDAPYVAIGLSDRHSAEDMAVDLLLPAGAFADIDSPVLTLSATLADGSALPDWLSFDAGARRFTGQPPADFNGAFTIRVTASDGTLEASDDFVLTIDPVNDAPIVALALVDRASAEDAPVSILLPPGTFADVDGDVLTLTATLGNGTPLPGWLSFDGAAFTGQPPADFNGTIALRVIASDGQASVSASFVLTISAVNDAPVLARALDDVSSPEDGAIAFVLPANSFSDVDGDALSWAATLANGDPLPSWLRFDPLSRAFTGTPPRDFNGALDVLVQVSDGQYAAQDGFRLTITPINDAPVLIAPLPERHSLEDTAIAFAIPPGTFGDVDLDPLTLTARLANGDALPAWLSFDGAGFAGTPPRDFVGSLVIEVIASDGSLSTSGTFRLSIDPVNDAPILVTPLADVHVPEDSAVAIVIPTDAFADIEGDALTYSARLVGGGGLPAWLTLDNGVLTGTPPTDFNGALDIEVLASDGQLAASDAFQLIIDPVNDAPIIERPIDDLVIAEDHGFNLPVSLSGFVDVDGDTLTFSAGLADGSPLPAWIQFAGGRLIGTPPPNYNGVLDLAITANDGALSVTDTFRLTVIGVNDAPTLERQLSDISSLEDAAIDIAIDRGAFADIDGDVLSFTARRADGTALPAWLSFDGTRLTGRPPANFNGAIDIEVFASDGLLSASDTFRLTIVPVNDAPMVAIALADRSINAATAIDFLLPAGSFTDVDGDVLTLSATLANGAALPNWLQFANGRFTGAAPAGTNTAFDIKVSASDGALSASDEFRLTVVGPTNTAPDAQDDALFITLQAQALIIATADLLINDSDPDRNALTIVSVQGGTHGTVGFDGNGNIVYSASGDYVGSDSFTYTITDGLLTDTATVSVRVDSIYTDWSQGSTGDDKLFGNKGGENRIFGGAGDDHIKGGQNADWLAGGDGNDNINALSGDDHLWGNAGNDQLNGNGGFDRAYFFGLRSSYSVVTSNGTVSVVDNAPSVDGNDGTDAISSIEQLVFKNGETASVVSPIILDLDGNGVTTVSAADSNARYDLDGDGLADDTSWIGNTEGFLFLDRDRNGTVTNAAEFSFIDDIPGATSDLVGLRAFDSNNDGSLSSADERFGDFRVWRDIDGDGAVDAGEVLTLASAGVASISLSGTPVNAASAFGDVAILNTGSYTRTNGVTMQFIDAALTYFSAASNMPDFVVQDYDFDRKASKYRLSISGGAMVVVSKKTKGLVDPAANRIAASASLTFHGKSFGMLGAVVLDLDGNGVDLGRSGKSNAMFDLDGDGAADDTGWTSARDGILVIDRDGDGMITSAAELSLAAEDDEAMSALEGLAQLDSNEDGKVDASDARFGELRVWVDANGNGRTDSGELKSLAELSIVSIQLRATAARDYTIKAGDNAVLSTMLFERANGSFGTAADVSFGFTPGDTPTSPVAQTPAQTLAFNRGLSLNDPLVVEPDFGAATSDAIRALSAGARPQPLSIFDLPSTPEAFDAFALGQMASQTAAAPTDQPPTGYHNQALPKQSQLRTDDALAGTVVRAADVSVADMEISRRVALLRQDMASFGAGRGEARIRDLHNSAGPQHLDYFA